MSALICGSYAYDNIMVFNDRFQNHILPDQVHTLNVSFLVPEMRRDFGGCAGNVCWNLKLLGGDGQGMGTVGEDFAAYAEWLDMNGIDRDYLRTVAGTLTAQAYITTDLDDNQITAFHPGAMNHSHENDIPTDAGITIGMVSPDGREGMMKHAKQFADAGIPFIFDPGQGLPMFDGDELKVFIGLADWVALNSYEAAMLCERTGWSRAKLAKQVKAVVITGAAEGSTLYADGGELNIPAAPADAVVDPTGCGDAYRAGLIHGIMNGYDWETTGRMASLLGAIKVAHHGTQNHSFSADEFADRFKAAFDYAF